ncbi:hypothetical protein D3C71_884480 [compost metagenome]
MDEDRFEEAVAGMLAKVRRYVSNFQTAPGLSRVLMFSPGFSQRCAQVAVVCLVGLENLVRGAFNGIIQRKEQVAARDELGREGGGGIPGCPLGLWHIARVDVGLAKVDSRFEMVWIQRNRGQVAGLRFLVAPFSRQGVGQCGVCLGVPGFEFDGTAGGADGFGSASQLGHDGGKHDIALEIGRRQVERGEGRQNGVRGADGAEERNCQRFPCVPEFWRSLREPSCKGFRFCIGPLCHQLVKARGLAEDCRTRIGLMAACRQDACIQAQIG